MMAVVPRPLYSPGLAPSNFFLFPNMKIKFKGRRFDTVEEIQVETQTVLNILTEKHFRGAFQRWQKCGDQLCALKLTTLKVMVQNKIQVRRSSFY
jgi:hypothetical protein